MLHSFDSLSVWTSQSHSLMRLATATMSANTVHVICRARQVDLDTILRYEGSTWETRANFCRSQSFCKSFCICKVFGRICICHKCYVNLKFAEGLNLLFTCTAHASLPQILSLWSICGDHKFDRILYICERIWEANQKLCGLQKLALVSRATFNVQPLSIYLRETTHVRCESNSSRSREKFRDQE
jgi:hypothetical protein